MEVIAKDDFFLIYFGRLFTMGEANELSVFDGLRVLSMLWVVLGHVLAVQVCASGRHPGCVIISATTMVLQVTVGTAILLAAR